MPEDAFLDGVGRDPLSDLFQMVACPKINLWDGPDREKVVGTYPHGTPVMILDEAEDADGRLFLKVRPVYSLKRGWVSDNFIARSVNYGKNKFNTE
jgi:hypothetical protein